MPASERDREPIPLAPAEWQVMKVLWDEGPLAARDVFSRLPNETAWAYKTVKTLLSRLVAKGALDYEQIGNSYLYRAVVARERMTRQEVRGLLDRVVSEATAPVIAQFIDEVDLNDEEIKSLKRLLDEKRRGRRNQ